MRRYPEYKDSGVEWVGEIPSHWEVRKNKTIFRLFNGYAFKSTHFLREKHDSPILLTPGNFLPNVGLYFNEKNTVHYTGAFPLEYLLQPNDLVVVMTDLSYKKLILGQYATVKHSNLFLNQRIAKVLLHKTVKDRVNTEFLKYALNSTSVREQVILTATGATVYHSSPRKIGECLIVLPLLKEQTQIASFLDRKTQQLDELIRIKERKIELLQEQRTALINQAVTKGLDPNVEMKPSGGEWIGERPEHWNIIELKRLVHHNRKITYGIVQPGQQDKNGRFMVRGQDYSSGWVEPKKIFRVSPAIEEPYRRARLQRGDLLLTIVGAGVGNIAIVPKWLDGANITQTTARLSIDSRKSSPRYVFHSLSGPIGKKNVNLWVKGAAQPGLNLEHVRLFILLLPPLLEQQKIADYLDQKTQQIDKLTSEEQQKINLLKEYRQSLISEVVTGKIDVRNEA